MAVAPHSAAAQSALHILREGGNALEAAISAAATIAVVYPHMNGLGGDSFWLVHAPGRKPRGIEACGAAAAAASREWYAAHGIRDSIPFRGGLAANTVAGTISGWEMAFGFSRRWGGRLPLKRLLADAIHYAERGIAVTRSQAVATTIKRAELEAQPGYAAAFLPGGKVPAEGSVYKQPRLAETLRRLSSGLAGFYRGRLAKTMARELAAIGSPLTIDDLAAHRATLVTPLELRHSLGTVYNMPPPTQGVVSLLILGMLDALRVGKTGPGSPDFMHLAVEATKRAFEIRDRCVTDPEYMETEVSDFLSSENIRRLAAQVDPKKAASWGGGATPSDTVWLGVVDGTGRAVSMIQSLYHEFGSGVVLEDSGVMWQNRGCSFSLDPQALNFLRPRRKPFHTLNPALAVLDDGRTLAYGTMGGDGQPQTQCAIFTRIANFGLNPQAAVSAPRWLLGRTWGQTSDTLKVEARFPGAVLMALGKLGHDIEVLQDYDETMGHAGVIVRHANGVLEGGADPRSDGVVAAY
jgi:oxamate amidohydrolase